jgi:tetratricopeptide (TPR) repeat protein
MKKWLLLVIFAQSTGFVFSQPVLLDSPEMIRRYDELIIDGDAHLALSESSLYLYDVKEFYGKESKEAALAMMIVAENQYYAGFVIESENTFIAALNILEISCGEESLEAFFCRDSLGYYYLYSNQTEKAKEYLLATLAYKAIVFGDKSIESAVTYNNLGLVYLELNDFIKAEECYLLELDIFNNSGDCNLDGNPVVLLNLAHLYRKEKKNEDAIVCLEKAFLLFEERDDLLRDFWRIKSALYQFTDLLKDQKDFDKVIERYLFYIKRFESFYGQDDIHLSGLWLDFALLYEYADDCKRACDCYQRALAISEKRYGPFDVRLIPILERFEAASFFLNDHDLYSKVDMQLKETRKRNPR